MVILLVAISMLIVWYFVYSMLLWHVISAFCFDVSVSMPFATFCQFDSMLNFQVMWKLSQ